jgi:methylaspartate mutase epsilon subunit
MAPNVKNQKIDEAEFLKMREKVLAQWPTGKEVDLDEAIEYQKKLPDSKNYLKIMQKLHEEGRTVAYPRAGTATIEDSISLYRKLEESEVPFLLVTTDSYTRQLEFKKVEAALEETKKTGKKILNGFPLINHGVKGMRQIVESVNTGAFNPRISLKAYPLGAEIAFASGMTGVSAGPFISWGAYEKNSDIAEAIAAYQYMHRLIGYYADRGVKITCDNHGWILTGVQPMTVNLATTIAEAMMEAEQGVKSVVSCIHLMGNLAQDLAWIRVAPRLMREYLDKYGYSDVVIAGTLAQHTPLFPMPQGMGGAFAYTDYSALVGALGKVEACSIRSIDEALGIPTEESHQLTYESVNWFFNVIRGQKIDLEMKEIAIEERIAELEIRAILDKLLEIGDGDIVVGCIKGVHLGIIDSSFSPNKQVKDKVIGVKDCRGAIRYAEFGNLPLPEEVKEFHREKVAERERADGTKADYEMTIRDFWAFNKGQLIGKPVKA